MTENNLPGPSVPGSESNANENPSPLQPPSHESGQSGSQLPGMVKPEEEKKDILKEKNIEVVAMRPGFIYQMRYNKGDKFTCKLGSQLGEWMECLDPSLEKLRKEFFKAKKQRKASV